MKKLIPYVILLTSFIGCSGSKTDQGYGRFCYPFNGEEYCILSQSGQEGKSGNRLLDSKGEVLGWDLNQDWLIDITQRGESFDKVQTIYYFGMNKAKQEKKIAQRKDIYRYDARVGNNHLIATCCGDDSLECRIELFAEIQKTRDNGYEFFSNEFDRILAYDEKSDGKIDTIEMGDIQLKNLQKIYDIFLDKGIMAKKIILENNKYKIVEKEE